MRVLRILCPILLLAAVGAVPAFAGEDVSRLLEQARERYERGERTAALDLLREATAHIRREIADLLASRLPDGAAGFTGEAPRIELPQGMGPVSGIVVKRRYTRNGIAIEVEIYRDAPFAQAMAGIASTAVLLAGQPGVRRTVIGPHEMLWTWQPDARRAEGVLSAGGTLLVVRGNSLDDPATFDAFLRALAPVLQPLP